MKHRTKRFFSAIVATSLLASQIPQLIFPVSANTPTMEQAYFQVLDDIVQEYRLCTDFTTQSGLLYADILDFDQNGKDELFLAYKPEGGSPVNEYVIEVWSYNNGVATCVLNYDVMSANADLYKRANGQYLLWSYSYTPPPSPELVAVELTEESIVYLENDSIVRIDALIPRDGSLYLSKYVDDVLDPDNELDDIRFSYYEHRSFLVTDPYKENRDTFVFGAIWDDFNSQWLIEVDHSLYFDLQANQNLELDEILAKLPYTGDISKIHMTAEQALAMAERIEEGKHFEYTLGTESHVALFDGGNGIPVLWVIENYEEAFNNDFFQYVDDSFEGMTHHTSIHYIEASTEMLSWNGRSLEAIENVSPSAEVNVNDTGTKLYNHLAFNNCSHSERYAFQNGILGEVDASLFSVTIPPSSTENQVEERKQIEKFSQDTYGTSKTLQFDWSKVEYFNGDYSNSYGSLYFIDGSTVDSDTYLSYAPYSLSETSVSVSSDDQGVLSVGNWADGKEVAALLRAYAEKANFRYSFPDQSADSAVTDLFSGLDLSGTLLECYEVVENFYCLVMDDNGTEITYLIRCVKKNGEIIYEIVSESTQLVEETELVSQGNDYLFQSNIALDFSELSNSTTVMDYVLYFTNALHNITGIRLNDSGKSDLTLYLQDAIGNFATTSLQIQGETGEVKGEQILPLIEKSNELTSAFIELLTAENEELNKDLEQCVRVVLQGLNEQNWTIYLNSDLINQLGDNNLQVFLSSGQEGIEIAPEDLDLLLNKYGGLFINVQSTGADQYAISFADAEGNAIEKLEAPVKIFLPTENQFATVILESVQGTENWGGQFNSSTNTIQFSTIHGGTYLIVDNSVEIHDVDDTYKTMIQFMVSKGFFEVDEEGNFHPNGTMTRNDFTKIIVTMFFALDRDLKSSFPDVLEDSPYYAYIASGESRDIVAGYDDGLFYGDIIMTEEMAFTLISQTLVDKKGYYYPDELDFYLNSVSGAKNSSEWSMQNIALSIRDSIILPDEFITPLDDISRQDAAIYLYRLFMLLEEKQQVSFELAEEIQLPTEVSSESGASGGSPVVFLVGGAGVALIGAALYLGKKKKV